MSRRPYPEYKSSGVEWLGEVPAHWEAKRLKHLCRLSALYGANESATAYIDEGVRFLRTTDITDDGSLLNEGAVYLDRSLVADYLLKDGDLLISRSGTLGRSFIYDERLHGQCAYAGYLVRFVMDDGLLPRFAFYFTKTKNFEQWLLLSAIASTIGNINGQKYANLHLPTPRIDEQRTIATFLDRETAHIDALIEKKQRQIELLQEKRSALISHAVTRGLDPHAPMKDSGVEWLGEVPAQWEIKRLKYAASINDESLPETTDPDYEFSYVDIGGVDATKGIVAKERHIFETAPSRARRIVRDGDTIVSTVRTYLRAIAPICEPKDHLIVSTGFAVVRPREIGPDYLSYALRSPYFVETVVSRSTGVSYPAINASEIGTIGVAIPPIADQRTIAAFLDRETARIDALIEKVEQSITMLREYRTALISAAVTGKIDVREEVA